ncbi:MAG: fumarate reductase subunit C, partial [Acidobacteria bacterium]|nr:fumarate reductase subunit C [Acidobacteriota bacterium]
FILRELTSVAVAWTVAVMLMQIFALTHSGAFYDGFEALMALPVMILVNVIAFAFLVFHSVTWFNLAPKAMAVRVGGKRVPGILISGPQYLAWIAVSAIVLFILATRT